MIKSTKNVDKLFKVTEESAPGSGGPLQWKRERNRDSREAVSGTCNAELVMLPRMPRKPLIRGKADNQYLSVVGNAVATGDTLPPRITL